MRICTARQMARIDRETIAGGVPGLELMERAGRALAEVVAADPSLAGKPGQPTVIVCGKGNNGGDGLVMARHLAERGDTVVVLLLRATDALSPDARTNVQRLPENVQVVAGERGHWARQIAVLAEGARLVVDAVFGTGIAPPLREEYVALCEAINQVTAPVLAVDVPTGVSGDDGRVDPVAVRADLTVTIGLPKLGLVVPPGRDFTGAIQVVDIGFAPEVCVRHTRDWHLLETADYLPLLPPRGAHWHKYDCGTLLVLAGSRDYGGAAHLTGLGALRAGIGLLTMGIPSCLETAVRGGLPEAIVRPLAMTPAETVAPLAPAAVGALIEKQTAVALGPGLGANPETDRFIVEFVGDLRLPLVLDADGLNAFARLDQKPCFATEQIVLTPHAGELARLTGLPTGEVLAGRLSLVPELAARWNAVLLLKGNPTVIGTPDGAVYLNPAGDDALARGGTGDVLTGVIGAFLAQGNSARDAALLGALVHGLAGNQAAETYGRRGLLTREVADAVATVLDLLDQTADGAPELRSRLRPIDAPVTRPPDDSDEVGGP